jgi:hypothetical protein
MAIGVAAIVGAATWTLAFRDTAEPVSVDEAVTSFRTDTDTEPAPRAPSPIPEGVYLYATSGFEKTDALTGVTHRYPARSTIAVAAADCGVSLTWRVLKGRSTEWVYCVTPDGWELRSQDERHTFFGQTERTTYVCDDTLIRPRVAPASRWRVTCSAGSSEETGSARLVAHGRERVGAKRVPAEHVRKRTTFDGEIRGTAEHDIWFASDSGVPAKIVMVSRTANDSPVGDVRYEEEVTLRLLSLEPRR